MKKLSAAEAIGPAWEHTKAVMCVPFRWQRYMKLGFVALIAQMATSGFSVTYIGLRVAQLGRQAAHLPKLPLGPMLMVIGLLVLVGLGVGLALFYIAARMQFVLFDVVATKQSAIGALWSKYSSKTWRWIGLKLLLGLACVMVIGIILVSTLPFLIAGIMHLSHANDTDNVVGEVGAGLVLSFVALVLGLFVFMVILSIIISLLHDFTLPYIALEDSSIGAALSKLKHFVKESPGEVTLYMLLKFALCIALGLAADMALLVALLITAGPYAIVGVPLYLLLHGHGAGATVLLVAAAVVGGVVLIAWLFVLCASIFGYLYLFLQSYALYFMGGRYELLGDLMEPPFTPSSEPMTVKN